MSLALSNVLKLELVPQIDYKELIMRSLLALAHEPFPNTRFLFHHCLLDGLVILFYVN